MGWFWADASARVPLPSQGVPPPACPMHQATPLPAACPVKHDAPSRPSACPVKHDSPETPSYISKLNPLNYMPTLPNQRESAHQRVNLSLDREESTIPRGSGGNWEYPSPQQMYNAMLRKGYTDTPAEHVTAMVAVHNFLNEGAWDEIRGWEKRFSPGLRAGWDVCKRGEQHAEEEMLKRPIQEPEEPTLLRFMGRPNDMTPKARMLAFMAKVWPAQYPDNPPFDRHDWFVARKQSDGSTREVRYVIDYYSGPPEPSGEPVFFLDVRPAVDSTTAAYERMIRWGGDVWYRAMGSSIREELAKKGS